ncbi:MAG: DUF1553 domain-containing protein [Verrucomicrobiota bacterium]|nr:DUF1553 domain-containing protein [Verrucomicrobiota bacterium]
MRYLKPNLNALIIVGLLLGCISVFSNTSDAEEFFEKQIRPVLVEHCYRCHSAGSEKIKGGFTLDSRESILKGGDSGSAVVPGDADKSLLIQAIRHSHPDLKMPKEKLADGQIKALEKWIQIGLPYPSAASSENSSTNHWSLKPVRKVTVPSPKSATAKSTEIDRFILAKLEQQGLRQVKPADRTTLIRRASYGLTGLPPTPAEVDAFVKDSSANAYEKLIDRLLASPHYGEQWGRHWLDVVRYADTSGCNSDFPVPSAFKYRNYVIDSFNQDKPYDQFIKEQLAGDLLPFRNDQERFEQTIATGYLAIARRFGSRANEFHLTIEDIIDNMGKAMLGMSLSCARCHNHKFDPISAKDYYALYGIFNSTRYAFPGTEIYKHPKDFIVLAAPEEAARVAAYEKELADLDDRIEQLTQERNQVERFEKLKAENKTDTSPEASQKKRRTLVEVKADLEDARTRQRRLEARPPAAERAYAVSEGKIENAKLHRKGDPGKLGDEIQRGFVKSLGGGDLPKAYPASGRRELADWIASPHHPLTARVMVNRIWQHHFGKGIVQTPNDFGTRGKLPTHPELLDYLANYFCENGWSIKAMHKLVMLSQTYQLATEDHLNPADRDVNNDYLAHFSRRRLSAEELRDSLLAIGGNLDRSRGMGHPFPSEQEWKYTQHTPFIAVYETPRRSIYLMQQRIKKQPFLEIFDGADPNAPTGERPLSTTALQALYFMNNEFMEQQADHLAVRIGMAERSNEDRITFAFRLLFGRSPKRDEIRMGDEFIQNCVQELASTNIPEDQRQRLALRSYARVMFSSNEFLYLD